MNSLQNSLIIKISLGALLALLLIPQTLLAAYQPVLQFDAQDRAWLTWSSVPNATEYCVLKTDPSNKKVCGLSLADKPWPVHALFEDLDKNSLFTVQALDNKSNILESGQATYKAEILANPNPPLYTDVVSAQTEFGPIADLGQYAQQIMRYALPIGITLSILMTIYAGIQFMLSQGQPDKLKDAKEIIQGAILGLIILIMARFLTNFLILPGTDETKPVSGQTTVVVKP